MSSICQNCDHPLDSSFVYCPECGQKTGLRRLRMREIMGDFWTQFTDIDKGFFTLLRSLVVEPGRVAREYISGKRKRHFGPLNFYLIVGTLLILSMNITEWIHASDNPPAVRASSSSPPTNDNTQFANPSAPPGNVTAESKKEPSHREKMNIRRKAVGTFWKQYSDLVSIAAAPLLCVFFWLFYRSSGFNYTELLVSCFYMLGFTNLVYAIIVSPINSSLTAMGAFKANYITTGFFKLFEIGYITYFCTQLTRGLVRRPLPKALVVSILVAIFWVALTFALMDAYIRTGFGFE